MAGTIRKIAQMAHVSPATVSRYFSGQNVVSDELSRRIEEAAIRLVMCQIIQRVSQMV